MCLCIQWVGLTEAATNRRHSARVFLLVGKRKRCVCLSWCKGFFERVSLWRKEVPLFRHAPISLHVRGLLRNSYFCIYKFNFFMLLSFFIFWAILTNLQPSSVALLQPSQETSKNYAPYCRIWFGWVMFLYIFLSLVCQGSGGVRPVVISVCFLLYERWQSRWSLPIGSSNWLRHTRVLVELWRPGFKPKNLRFTYAKEIIM